MSSNQLETTEAVPERSSILIVDDLPEKLLVFQTVLEDLGQNLVMAHSGAQALREILHQEFAVILLDVNMPDIDGLETAQLIRQYKRTAHTPIIFITSYADEIQTARGYSLGAVDYILSPVIPEVLRSKVKVFVQLFEMQQRTRLLAEERVTFVQAEAARKAAEETTRRSDFLSRASRELGASLDLHAGMHRLAELLVPQLADLAVMLVDTDDDVMLVRSSPTDQTLPFTRVLEPLAGLPLPVSECLERAMREGRSIQIALDAAAMIVPEERSQTECWRNDLRTLLAVPLRIGDRSVGVMALANVLDAPAYGAADLATIDELASRAAIAFENARLYRSLQQEIVKSRQAEELLHDAGRRKDEFLAMLSHELRNPLAPIRNAVEVMRRVVSPEPSLTWARDVVDRQVSHLARLIEELLDVSRISQGKIVLKKEVVELGLIISHGVETVRPLIESRHHSLSVNMPSAQVWLEGDFARLAQVVANLLHNAAKYTEDGGRIELTAIEQDDDIVITVRDDGIGIDPALMPRIFDLFAQGERSLDRSQGGLGIGLTLVQRLVDQHQGRVLAHSAGEGKGAELKVILPRLRNSIVVEQAVATNAPVVSKATCGARVLIVDDSADAAESVAIFLQIEGHEVATAYDGVEALTAVGNFLPEVVVIDIGLPGISGYEVARRLRAIPEYVGLLLIALTGYGQKEDQLLALQAGFDHHFVKPTNPQEIHKVIAAHLARDNKTLPGHQDYLSPVLEPNLSRRSIL